MPCISPDGKLTESGTATLRSIKAGASSPSEIAASTGRELFLVRSGLRELVAAGVVEVRDGRYLLTPAGEKAIQ